MINPFNNSQNIFIIENFLLLFNLGSEEAAEKIEDAPEKADEQPKDDIKPVHEEPEPNEAPKPTEDQEKVKNETDTKPAAEEKPANQTDTDKVDKKITVTVLKEPIESSETKFGPQVLSGDKLLASREKYVI